MDIIDEVVGIKEKDLKSYMPDEDFLKSWAPSMSMGMSAPSTPSTGTGKNVPSPSMPMSVPSTGMGMSAPSAGMAMSPGLPISVSSLGMGMGTGPSMATTEAFFSEGTKPDFVYQSRAMNFNLMNGCFGFSIFQLCWDLDIANLKATITLKGFGQDLGTWVLDTNQTCIDLGGDIGVASAKGKICANWNNNQLTFQGKACIKMIWNNCANYNTVLIQW
jgi:hypothetical protein